MGSENKTPNIGLNQWQGNEYPKRQDFNNDNLKVDEEINRVKQSIDNVEVPVTSVNNKTGDVNLTASDIGAETPAGAQAKADTVQDDLDGHKADGSKHITAEERASWNAKPSSQRAVSDSVSSTSSSTAASSRAIKTAYDKANQAFQSASDGKQQIATAITGMGQGASGSDTFATLAAKIEDISNDATAATSNVLSGKTFYQGGSKKTGNMPNNGSMAKTITTQGGKIYVPKGYHSGSGYVKAQFGNLVAGNIKNGVNVGGVRGTYSGRQFKFIHFTRTARDGLSTLPNNICEDVEMEVNVGSSASHTVYVPFSITGVILWPRGNGSSVSGNGSRYGSYGKPTRPLKHLTNSWEAISLEDRIGVEWDQLLYLRKVEIHTNNVIFYFERDEDDTYVAGPDMSVMIYN